MKIIKAFPPNFSEIAKVFPVKGKQGILYAFGNKLYNPSGITVPAWIMAHEETHERQQSKGSMDVAQWWHLYLRDSYFRFYEELEAHQVEYKAYQQWSDKPSQDYLDLLAKRLSSPLYQLPISYEEAKRRISDGGH